MARSVVVTGADSGIGLAVTRVAVERGWRVFGSVRGEAGYRFLQESFGTGVTPLYFDVRDETHVAMAADQVRASLGPDVLDGLVNNAGIGIPAPLLHQPLDEIRAQLDTNLFGSFLVTKTFLPLLGADRPASAPKGRVVVMSSIGGVVGQPFATAYSASKFGLEGFAEALRRELQIVGIGVVVVAPAEVATPIWDKAEEQDLGRFDGTPYGEAFRKGVGGLLDHGRRSLDPREVGETVMEALTADEPSLRYAPAEHPLLEQVGLRMLPRSWVDRLMRRRLGGTSPMADRAGDRPASRH